MNLITIMISAATVLLLLAALLTPWRAKRTRASQMAAGELLFANIAEGTHEEFITKTPEAAIATRFLIAKHGSTDKLADLCGVSDIPIGIFQDTTGTTTDLTNPVAIALLGASDETRKVAINSTVTKDDYLVAGAGSYGKTLPTTAGKYYVLGRALQSGVAGDVIEFDPQPFVAIVSATWVPTASTTAAATDLATSEALANALKADLGTLKTLLDAAGITKT